MPPTELGPKLLRTMRPAPVDARQSFPELEEEVLERWRERDVFHESVAPPRGRRAVGLLRGPADRQRPPGLPPRPGARLQGHLPALQDDDRPPRRAQGRLGLPRPAGGDRRRAAARLQRQAGHRGATASPSSTSSAASRSSSSSRSGTRSPSGSASGSTSTTPTARSTPPTSSPCGGRSSGSGTRTCSTRASRSSPTARAAARRSPPTRSPQGYQDVEDPSVYVRFPVTRPAGTLQAGDELLVWTTTPWTLVSNAAVAVDPDSPTCAPARPRAVVLAEALVERVLGEDARGRSTASRARRSSAPATSRRSPSSPAGVRRRRATPCCPATSSPPRTAPASCTPRSPSARTTSASAQEQGLTVVNPVRPDGTYDERIGPYAGRWVKDADADLVEDLRARGRLLRAEPYLHAYPHCWRCGTPLLYYAKPSWYIRTTALRDNLLAANETVDWHPRAHQARALRALAGEQRRLGALARALLGHPAAGLALRRTATSHCVGSFDELEELSGVRLEDPHRPYVDDVAFPCPHCGEPMRRVPEVIDVWFDSGSMPFAQHHAPFENQEHFDAQFPADYICEAHRPDARLVLLAARRSRPCSTTARPIETVLCLGHILDGEGRKMSKSLGNIVDPWAVIDRYGADAFRWFFLTSKQPWDGYRFSVETVGESVRQFLLQLWNIYCFYADYANATTASAAEPGEPTDLDRWVALAPGRDRGGGRASGSTPSTPPRAGRAIADFVDDLSNWYVRRSRRRFWDGDPAAFATLRTCLSRWRKLLAPFSPVHGRRDLRQPRWRRAERAPVRLPGAAGSATPPRGGDGGRARDGAARAGRARRRPRSRSASRCAPRWSSPPGASARRSSAWATSCARSSTSRSCATSTHADELGSYDVKPNYRSLGPRFGKQMPQVAAAVAALDPAHVAAALRDGPRRRHQRRRPRPQLAADDLLLAHAAARGLPARARGLARRRAGARARRRAAPRGPRPRARPRRPERPQGRRASTSRTASR